VARAIESGWVAPLGPEVDAFEQEIAAFCGRRHAVALSSGTAGLHLSLLEAGVSGGDDVIVPTLTFGATAFAVTYVGARPVFLDVETESWNLDPELLSSVLGERAARGRLPAAVVSVDIFGQPCDYERIAELCAHYEVPLIADAAEALGATYRNANAGQFGRTAVFSFNGNKIMTTSGGGMVVTDDPAVADKIRFWSTQSREPLPWYEHAEIGYNSRLSNVLAALGRAQLARLPGMIERRREIRGAYTAALGRIPGITVSGDPSWGRSNAWLTTVLFDPEFHPDASRRVREALEGRNIEARPLWKPMHRQPVFAEAESHITGLADRLFDTGLCLPSGSAMSDEDVVRVVGIVEETLAA
jgi:dTDP-4-amino-4,6-dideoxygalactose transaminase